jgi:hypothetical protein
MINTRSLSLTGQQRHGYGANEIQG